MVSRMVTNNALLASKAPNLLKAPDAYNSAYQEQLNSALRLYFNQLDNITQTLLSNSPGGRFLPFPYGAFQDTAYTTLDGGINNSVTTITVVSTTGFPTAGQIRIANELISYTGITLTTFTGCTRGAFGSANVSHLTGAVVTKIQATAANTAVPMYLNLTDLSNGVSIEGTNNNASRIIVAHSGIYNLQWSGQFNNFSTSVHDVSVWLRVDGVDVPGTSGLVAIPSSHGGVDGQLIVGWNYLIQLNSEQYVELYWSTDNQEVTLECYAPLTSPTRPATASVIMTLSFVSAINA